MPRFDKPTPKRSDMTKKNLKCACCNEEDWYLVTCTPRKMVCWECGYFLEIDGTSYYFLEKFYKKELKDPFFQIPFDFYAAYLYPPPNFDTFP